MKQKKNDRTEEQLVTPPVEASEAEPISGADAEPGIDQLRQLQEQQIADLENHLIRLHADFDNYRRRVMRDREEQTTQVEAAVLRCLLPVLDNFDRALSVFPEEGEMAWVEGVRLVQRQLTSVLNEQGLQAIDCQEQSFDPNLHEAVMRDESGEAEDGTILQELQRGYQYKGKVLRPSMVKVASQPQDTPCRVPTACEKDII